MNDDLGDRIKRYEDCFRTYLPNRVPVILRLDGKAWHSLTRKCKRPFDEDLINAVNETAIHVCENIQGCKLAYTQSDEIQFLIYNKEFKTESWFKNNLQKMVSISAALASSYFTAISSKVFGETKLVQFDSRVFIVPLDEVVNSFIFRQQDCSRNSIQMLARSLFSHKQCNNKKCNQLQEMCFQAGVNWNNLPTHHKRGRCIIKEKQMKAMIHPITGQEINVERRSWVVDNEIPIFQQDRNYIEKLLM